MATLDAGIILRFLDSLEKNRGNSVVSRNLRLTAIRSFYRMVAFRDPASAGVATHVLAIPLMVAVRPRKSAACSSASFSSWALS